MARSARPEYAYAAAWVNAQGMIAISSSLTGGPHSPVLPWLAIPVVSLAARFTTRGSAAGVALTLLFLCAATLGVDAAAVVDAPQTVLFPAVVIVSIALLGSALMHSDVAHRSAAVIDPLTQMLNRSALSTRLAELAQQSMITGDPIALVVGDVDRFKAINDEHGHSVGDTVLRDLAYELRKALRAFDLAYRLGGEEFLVVLPGATTVDAHDIAERLRRAVGDRLFGGVAVTMSFGVASSSAGSSAGNG